MYPEFIGRDDCHNANEEERLLYTIRGKDNKAKYLHCLCVLALSCSIGLSWIFRHAVSTLHPGTAPMRLGRVIRHRYMCSRDLGCRGVCGQGRSGSDPRFIIFPKSWHRWCGWHRISQNFTNHPDYKCIHDVAKNRCIESRVEVDLMVRYLWYCFKHYEKYNGIICAQRLMDLYLTEGD